MWRVMGKSRCRMHGGAPGSGAPNLRAPEMVATNTTGLHAKQSRNGEPYGGWLRSSATWRRRCGECFVRARTTSGPSQHKMTQGSEHRAKRKLHRLHASQGFGPDTHRVVRNLRALSRE